MDQTIRINEKQIFYRGCKKFRVIVSVYELTYS